MNLIRGFYLLNLFVVLNPRDVRSRYKNIESHVCVFPFVQRIEFFV